MYFYVVECWFADGADELAARWLAWLIPDHLNEVLAAGALSAEVVQFESEFKHFEIRYQFASREAFQEYERDHAPRLRADGLAKFPLELGITYRRRTGFPIAKIAPQNP